MSGGVALRLLVSAIVTRSRRVRDRWLNNLWHRSRDSSRTIGELHDGLCGPRRIRLDLLGVSLDIGASRSTAGVPGSELRAPNPLTVSLDKPEIFRWYDAGAGRAPALYRFSGLREGDGLQNEVAHRQSGCLDSGPGFRTRFESRDGAIDDVAPAGNLPGGKRRAGKAVEVSLSDLPLREIRVGELVINLDRQSLARFRRRIVEKRGSSRSVPGVSIALAADSGQKDQTHGDRNQNASHETEQPQNWNRKH